MKIYTTIAIATILISCNSKQPKCTDKNIIATVKSILAKRSYLSFKMEITDIRTMDNNNELNMCTCAGTLYLSLNKDNTQHLPIKYTAQRTDDGKDLMIEIINQDN